MDLNKIGLGVLVIALAVSGCSDDEGGKTDGGAGTGGSAGHGGDHGGFDAGSEGDRNTVAPGEICDRISTIQCAGEAHCCDAPGRTEAECKAEMMKGCTDDLMLDEIAMEDVVGYDTDASTAAFTEFEKRASECDPSVATWAISDDGFQGLLKGTVASGGTCTPSDDTDLVSIAAALGSCSADGEACAIGDPDWTCTAQSGVGGDCTTDYNCADGHFCESDKCVARKANGESCTATNECDSLTCEGDECVEASVQTAYCLAE